MTTSIYNTIEKVDYLDILSETYNTITPIPAKGKVASYIPELAKIDDTKFGVHFRSLDGVNLGLGDYEEKFSIQSISKVFSLMLAYKLERKNLWKRVGVEPSGTAYNSLILLELEKGIPRNPFINAGAIVIIDILISILDNPVEEYLSFVRSITGNQSLNYCKDVAESEKKVAYGNFALFNLMKAKGNINNGIEEVMDFYFKTCSIEMTCKELTESFILFANRGVHPVTGEKILEKNMCKRINSIMELCGFYDEAGEFAFRVGLPGKSGVGGGIVAIQPNKYCVCTWSPKLNKKGNSAKGMLFLEEFTTKLEDSIF